MCVCKKTLPFQVQQFLSDVGGAVGLWIGLSMLSLCEVVQLFIEMCDYGVHVAKKNSRYKHTLCDLGVKRLLCMFI